MRRSCLPAIGLSLEQPRWVQAIRRFVVGFRSSTRTRPPSVRQRRRLCNYGQGPTTLAPCDGALPVIDPTNTTTVALPPGLDAPPAGTIQVALTVWNPATQTGIIPLSHLHRSATPSAAPATSIAAAARTASPSIRTTGYRALPVRRATTPTTSRRVPSSRTCSPTRCSSMSITIPSPQVTGGDELWLNFASCTFPMNVVPQPTQLQCAGQLRGSALLYRRQQEQHLQLQSQWLPEGNADGAADQRSGSRDHGRTPTFQAALGYNALPLIGTIPVSTGSHSVAADSIRNNIFVPFVAPPVRPRVAIPPWHATSMSSVATPPATGRAPATAS